MKHSAYLRTSVATFFGILFSIGFFFQNTAQALAAPNCCTCSVGVIPGGATCQESEITKEVDAKTEDDAKAACAKACTSKGNPDEKCTKSFTQLACPKPAAADGSVTKANTSAKIPPLDNPLGTTSIPTILGRIVNMFLGISGSLALLMFVFGGFTWITSGGAPDKIKKGKDTLIWAAIGIAFIFSSYAIIASIIKAFNAAGQ